MNTFATARFTLHFIISGAVLALLAMVLIAPTLIPASAGWILAGVSLTGAVVLFTIAVLKPKETAAANDELSSKSQVTAAAFGYWTTLVVFLVFLGLALTGKMEAKTAFYFLGFPLGIMPSLYMVVAFLRGRAG